MAQSDPSDKYQFWYVADVSIPKGGPRENQIDASFNWLFQMLWFVATDPQARAAVGAGRFRFFILDRASRKAGAALRDHTS